MYYDKERKSISSLEQEMQTCGHNFGKNYMIWQRGGILVEVEHVKAHRTKKEEEKVTQLGMFVTEGNEKAAELARSRSNVGRRIHGRSESRNYAAGMREGVCSLAVCGQLSLLGGRTERL